MFLCRSSTGNFSGSLQSGWPRWTESCSLLREGRGDLCWRQQRPFQLSTSKSSQLSPPQSSSRAHAGLASVVQGLLFRPAHSNWGSRAEWGREFAEVGGKLLKDTLTVSKECANLFLYQLLKCTFSWGVCMSECDSVCQRCLISPQPLKLATDLSLGSWVLISW